MNLRLGTALLLMLPLANLGCDSEFRETIELRARATVLPGPGPARVRVEVDTVPGASVLVHNMTFPNASIGQDAPTNFPKDARTDGQGHWVGEAELFRNGDVQRLEIRVVSSRPSKRPFSRETVLQEGEAELQVTKPFRMFVDARTGHIVVAGEHENSPRVSEDCELLKLSGLPEGASVTLRETTQRAANGEVTLRLPWKDLIGSLQTNMLGSEPESLSHPTGVGSVRLPLTLTLADGTAFQAEQELSTELKEQAMKYLRTLKPGTPAPVQPEDPQPCAGALIVSMPEAERNWSGLSHFVGAVCPLNRLRIVVQETPHTRTIGCGTYSDASGRTAGASVESTDLSLVAFDRRTGAVVGRKVFRAGPASCPSSIYGRGGSVGGSSVSRREVNAWVQTLLP